jgi:hypothetical protein
MRKEEYCSSEHIGLNLDHGKKGKVHKVRTWDEDLGIHTVLVSYTYYKKVHC